MNAISINEAEAILEAFYDGGSSERPNDKRSLLEAYTVAIPENVVGSVSQTWCDITVTFEKGDVGASIAMSRTYNLDLQDYDVFRLFASLPASIRCDVHAHVDGESQTILSVVGDDTRNEFDGPVRGKRLSNMEFTFTLLEPHPACVLLVWTGLANRERQTAMESRPTPYTAEWEGMFVETPGKELFEPRIGTLFGSTELEALRDRVRQPALAAAYQTFKDSLDEAMDWEPEQEIDRYIPYPDDRWVRVRDRGKHRTAGTMEALAFVGLIEKDPAYLRMAARMALSVAHCEVWTESIMGCLPGATWHHRSFTEEVYCQACGLVLDWAGNFLTPHARQVIADAIAMKGLPRIESDFKRMEYIRHINQGIAFSSGRIFGALALCSLSPRYEALVDEAERDLHEMIGNYVQSDGGTLEGPGYWCYTFGMVMPMLVALARRRGQALSEYATETLIRTAAYGIGMLSTSGDGGQALGVNDCGLETRYPVQLTSAFALLTGDTRWYALARNAMARKIAAAGPATDRPDFYQFILAADAETQETAPLDPLTDRYDFLPATGQVSSVRDGIHFHLTSGPTLVTHYHEDKGSFILEAGGEMLVYDRGSTHYGHPEIKMLRHASRHNLLYPESPDGRLLGQPGTATGATLTCDQRDGIFTAVSDNLTAWEEGLFTRNLRRVFSPVPNLYLIDDEVQLTTPMPMSFRLNTPLPPEALETRQGRVTIRGEQFAVHLVPLNWTPFEVTAATAGIDSRHQPATLIRLLSPSATHHRLLAALIVLPIGDALEERVDNAEASVSLCIGDAQYAISIMDNGLKIQTTDGDVHTI